MADKDLILILTAEQGYLHNTSKEEYSLGNEPLFSAISNTYIPLLNMFTRLENEEINFKIGMVFSPTLCTLLTDKKIQTLYVEWLDQMIALGDEELERNKDNSDILQNVRLCLKQLQKNKIDFIDTYNSNLVKAFRTFSDKGFIELIPTSATYTYLPHYRDLEAVLNAQIEVGIHAHRVFFGSTGEGFYLPYLGWDNSFDRILRSYGINYTIMDTKSVLFAQTPPETGIFSPVRTKRSLVVFGRDWNTPNDIKSDEDETGFSFNKVYRNQQRDIGYEIDDSILQSFYKTNKARLQTGYKYWANEDETPYDAEAAKKQVLYDAQAFYDEKFAKLSEAEKYLDGKENILTCTIPSELLGTVWYEGIDWLENVIRIAAAKKEIVLSHCRDHLENQFSLPKIVPYSCSAEGTGYGENLLDKSNSWMMNYVRIASERMIDLTERFPAETGIKARLLNLGAREVLLAESDSWQKMIYDGTLPEHASNSFKHSIQNFNIVFDSLASNTVSTEWLCNTEKEDNIFPWLSYKVFSPKK